MSIRVLVPTRERPKQALLTFETFMATKQLWDTQIVFGIDRDEPYADAYDNLIGRDKVIILPESYSGSFVKVLNGLVPLYSEADTFGVIGDDHRFRTLGWDRNVAAALEGRVGIAYANDLYMRDWLPTACFISREIPDALDYIALPTLGHLYVDNFWKDIGAGLGELHYLPGTIIEHLHYTNGKSTIDKGYRRTNSKAQFSKDQLAYEKWNANQFPEDIARIKRYLDARTSSPSHN